MSKNGEYSAKFEMKYGGSIKSQSQSSLPAHDVYNFSKMLHYGKSVLSTEDIPLTRLFVSKFVVVRRRIVETYGVLKLGKILKISRRKPPNDLKHIPISESDVFHIETNASKNPLRAYLVIIKNKDNKSFDIAGNSTRYMTQLFFIDSEKDYQALISKQAVQSTNNSTVTSSSSTDADPFGVFDTTEEKPKDILSSYPVPLVSHEYLEENEYEADPE